MGTGIARPPLPVGVTEEQAPVQKENSIPVLDGVFRKKKVNADPGTVAATRG